MHFADPSEMQRKLKAEGIPVVDDQIQAFDSFFWDPKELG
jgi:methylated-DNA-protein-cysteine methyltransferase-like protein